MFNWVGSMFGGGKGGPPIIEKSYSERPGLSGTSSWSIPSREEAMQYVAFARCISLLSGQASDIITNGLRVVDKKSHDYINSPKARRVIELLTETPDGIQSSYSFIRDIFSDYIVEGNSLVHITFDRNGNAPERLTRLNSTGASIIYGSREAGPASIVYYATPYGTDINESYPIRTVIHSKFTPMSSEYVSSDNRQVFATSPLEHLCKAIRVGKNADDWVGNFFDDAAKNNLVISFPGSLSPENQERIIRVFAAAQTSRRNPLVMFEGADVKEINPTPQKADALALREFSAMEIGRYYAVPAPLLGINVTNWGSGIEVLGRLYYKYGFRLFLKNFLEEFSFKLLPRGQVFAVDESQEVRGDTAAQASLIASARPTTNNPAVISRKELREKLGYSGEFEDDWEFDSHDPMSRGNTSGGTQNGND